MVGQIFLAKHGLTSRNVGKGLVRLQQKRSNGKRGKREDDSKYRKTKKKPGNCRTWRPLLKRRLTTKTALQADRDYVLELIRKRNSNFKTLAWRQRPRAHFLSAANLDNANVAKGTSNINASSAVAAQQAEPNNNAESAVGAQQAKRIKTAESAVAVQRANLFLSRAYKLRKDDLLAKSEPRKDLALVLLAEWVIRDGESLLQLPRGAEVSILSE